MKIIIQFGENGKKLLMLYKQVGLGDRFERRNLKIIAEKKLIVISSAK